VLWLLVWSACGTVSDVLNLYIVIMNSAMKYKKVLQDLIAEEARPIHKYGHQARLYELTKEIGAGLAYDDDVVFAAVWLHDLGVFEGNRPADPEELQCWDHVAYAVRRTKDLLAKSDFPDAKIQQVIQVIEEHQPKDVPMTIEAKIVRDADILEQLGAIAVMRTAAKLGNDTRFVRFADAKNYLERMLEELPPKLQLDQSKKMALGRQQSLGKFLAALDGEAGMNIG
jgi:uncharacterized protein